MEHPAIDHLAATPEILRLLMSGISEEQAAWKPAPDRWSLAEVLEHLSHVEAHCFRARIDLITAGENPELIPYDEKEFDAQGAYSNREAEESFAHWEERREDNLEALRELESDSLLRSGMHPEFGRLTIEEILNAWAFHDLGHIRQIAELVRAQLYFPNLGPFRGTSKVNP